MRGCGGGSLKIRDKDGKWHEVVTYNVVFG